MSSNVARKSDGLARCITACDPVRSTHCVAAKLTYNAQSTMANFGSAQPNDRKENLR